MILTKCSHESCELQVPVTPEGLCGGDNEITTISCGNFFCADHHLLHFVANKTIYLCYGCSDVLDTVLKIQDSHQHVR